MAFYLGLIVCYAATVWCWLRVWRSHDLLFFKIALTVIAAVPFVGPFLYFFVDMPPRRPRDPGAAQKKPSAFLTRYNEREPVYLFWASAVFCSLALLAYWMNDWQPGSLHALPILWAWYTDVDVIFFTLLIGAVLTLGAAIRIKLYLARQLRELGMHQGTRVVS